MRLFVEGAAGFIAPFSNLSDRLKIRPKAEQSNLIGAHPLLPPLPLPGVGFTLENAHACPSSSLTHLAGLRLASSQMKK